jgi:hypothetical protein
MLTPFQVNSAEPCEPGLQLGSWTLAHIPMGWEVIQDHGIRRAEDQISASNVVATEEEVSQDALLREYVDSQIRILSEIVSNLRVECTRPATVPGATEALEVEIRYQIEREAWLVQRQVYALAHRMVGILTCTTLAERFHASEVAFNSIIAASTFGSGEPL